MRALLLSLALLASSCAGTCSAIGGGSIGHGAIGSGAIGNGAIGGQQATAATCDPFGSPDLAFMGCNVDGSNNTTLANNDPVCTWHDSGSLGVDATQGTGTACPTFVEGGGPNGTRDAVVFDGGDYLSTAALGSALAQPNLIAMVGAASVAVSIFIDGDTSDSQHAVYFSTMGPNHLFQNAGATLDSDATMVSGQWESILAMFDGASSSARVSGVAGPTGNAGAESPAGFKIGAWYDGSSFFLRGSIADVLVYDTPPTTADVEAYLADHHASTFPVAP